MLGVNNRAHKNVANTQHRKQLRRKLLLINLVFSKYIVAIRKKYDWCEYDYRPVGIKSGFTIYPALKQITTVPIELVQRRY